MMKSTLLLLSVAVLSGGLFLAHVADDLAQMHCASADRPQCPSPPVQR